MTQYIALRRKNGRKGYGVMVPDFPGCVSAGRTIEDALREGAEALALHVNGMREDGEKIPKPRTLETIREAGQDWVDMKKCHRCNHFAVAAARQGPTRPGHHGRTASCPYRCRDKES